MLANGTCITCMHSLTLACTRNTSNQTHIHISDRQLSAYTVRHVNCANKLSYTDRLTETCTQTHLIHIRPVCACIALQGELLGMCHVFLGLSKL